jgi:hypothetical protein
MRSMQLAMIGTVYIGTLHGKSAKVVVYRTDGGLVNHVVVTPTDSHNQRLSPMDRTVLDNDILGTLGADEVGIFTPVAWETNNYYVDMDW